jgi:hypothetical protein
MSIFPPVSVQIVDMRIQFIGYSPSVSVSTRLGIWTQSKFTSGIVMFPPITAGPVAFPVCTMDSSHIPARVPSPGGGNVWVNVQASTSL